MEQVLAILAVMLGFIVSFFVTWGSYHYAAKLFVYDGISSYESLKIASIETFYIIIIFIMYLIPPLGILVGAALALFLPYIMVKVLKKKFETGWIIAIGAFVMVEIIKAVVYLPFHLISG